MRTETEWANTPTMIAFTMADPADIQHENRKEQIVESLFRHCAQMATDDGKQVIGDEYRVQILPMSQSPLTGNLWHLTTPAKAQKVRVLIERPIIETAT